MKDGVLKNIPATAYNGTQTVCIAAEWNKTWVRQNYGKNSTTRILFIGKKEFKHRTYHIQQQRKYKEQSKRVFLGNAGLLLGGLPLEKKMCLLLFFTTIICEVGKIQSQMIMLYEKWVGFRIFKLYCVGNFFPKSSEKTWICTFVLCFFDSKTFCVFELMKVVVIKKRRLMQ